MGAPIFIITTAAPSSIRQYFRWKSGEGTIYTVSGVDASVNHIYSFQGTDGTRSYYQSSTDATRWLVIDEYDAWEGKAYLCDYDGNMVGQNPDTYDDYSWYYDPSSDSNPFNSYMWIDNNPNTWGDPPSATTSTNGTGLFSWKLDAGAWSADSADNFAEITGLQDGISYTLYVREKLQDASYSAEASQAFTVAFDNGSMVIVLNHTNVETDLTNYTVNFSFPSYESKLLTGLTTDQFDLMGLWPYLEQKNGQPAFSKDGIYLWYDSNSNRWVMTQANYYNGTWSFDDYSFSYMYANTTGTAFPLSNWYSGMEADMGQIAGTITWASGEYAVFPIGSGAARYRVDGGAWVDLDQDATSFALVLEIDHATYSVEIQELLENGLYTDSATISIDCALLAAPTVGIEGGGTTSDGGRNVNIQWSSSVEVAGFDGSSLYSPLFWDINKQTEGCFDDVTIGSSFFFHNPNGAGTNGFVAIKLNDNQNYLIRQRIHSDSTAYKIVAPDLTVVFDQYQSGEHQVTMDTATYGAGIWFYGQPSGNVLFDIVPAPEKITAVDIATLSILLGASGVFGTETFRYRINSGPWSAETTDSEAIQMFQLPTGENLIEVQEKSNNGVWSATGSMTLTVTNGAEAGGGVTVPEGKHLVVFSPDSGKEYLWGGNGDIDQYEPVVE